MSYLRLRVTVVPYFQTLRLLAQMIGARVVMHTILHIGRVVRPISDWQRTKYSKPASSKRPKMKPWRKLCMKECDWVVAHISTPGTVGATVGVSTGSIWHSVKKTS